MPVARRSRRIAPAATRAAPDMIWPVASSMTAMVSSPPGRRMTSGATIAGRTPGSTSAGDEEHDQRDAQRDCDDDERLGTRREALGEEQHRSYRESQKPGEQNPQP